MTNELGIGQGSGYCKLVHLETRKHGEEEACELIYSGHKVYRSLYLS